MHCSLFAAALATPSQPAVTIVLTPGLSRALPTPVPALDAAVADADRSRSAGLEMQPSQAYRWVLAPGEPLRVTVRSKAGRVVVLTAWDWENRPAGQAQMVPGASTRVVVNVDGRGTYVLTLDALSADGSCERLVRSFSVCPPASGKRGAWRTSGFWVGQCSFPAWHSAELVPGHPVNPPGLSVEQSRVLDAELVARMGVQVARINLDVRRTDETGMALDFTTADACVRAYVSRGLKLALQIFPPAGPGVGPIAPGHPEATPGEAPIYPMQEAPYRHLVREVARRYGRHALFFQVGNEPGNPHQYRGTADEYVASFMQARDEIRRLLPRVPVTNGGYCMDNSDTVAIVRGIGRGSDFASYHYHGSTAGMRSYLARIREMHESAGCGGGALANTEMGFAMPTVGGEKANAVHNMQKLLTCWAEGHVGALLYSSRELWWPRQFAYNGISDYGFVDHHYCPRFIYGAASAFLDRFAGYRFDRKLPAPSGATALAFRRGRRTLLSLFSDGEPVDVTVRSERPPSAMIDPMGNARRAARRLETRCHVGAYPVSVVYPDPGRLDVTTPSTLSPHAARP